MLKRIYKKLKKYNTIVIARHIGPDPDALGSQIALRDILVNAFPRKRVYAVGVPASKFKFMGSLDKMAEEFYEDSLLIALDTPLSNRLDGVDSSRFKDSIKIDHHPLLEEFCQTEWIDEGASSVCQMIMELCYKMKIKINKYAAERLFMGLVSDTNRFLFDYTSTKTFELTTKLLREAKIETPPLYEELYLKPLNEIKFQGYIAQTMSVTENGVGHILLKDETIKEYKVDTATAGNLVNNFNYIEEILVWVMVTEDPKQNVYRVNIRSRGPIINGAAEEYNGGGHKYASGTRLTDYGQVEELIKKLDDICKQYKEEHQ